MTHCKGIAFELISGYEYPNGAWGQLVQHYRRSGLKERRRLSIALNSIKMKLGEHPGKLFVLLDRMVKELERVGRPVDPDDVDAAILNG